MDQIWRNETGPYELVERQVERLLDAATNNAPRRTEGNEKVPFYRVVRPPRNVRELTQTAPGAHIRRRPPSPATA